MDCTRKEDFQRIYEAIFMADGLNTQQKRRTLDGAIAQMVRVWNAWEIVGISRSAIDVVHENHQQDRRLFESDKCVLITKNEMLNAAQNRPTDDALRVRSVSDDGSADTAPAAPALLAAEALSSSAVELTWEDRSDDEYGFRIRRSVAGGAWQSAGNVGAGETVFVDRDLLPDTGDDYTVVVFNATGESAEATASVTTLAASSIELTGNGYKVKGEKTVDLNWQGLTSGNLLRNGVPVFTISGETG